jgi:SAM-dependent methyltransferase
MADVVDPYGATNALFYDEFATGVLGDVAFYVAQARAAGSPVLELGCGTGRVLFPIAEAGLEAVGLDASPDMLAVAQRKCAACSPELQRRVRLDRGDMRDFTLGRRFRLVVIPYRAFLHNLEPADQLRTLACAREHLVVGGRLVFNVFDPDVKKLAAGRWVMPPERRRELRHPVTGNPVRIREEFRYDLERQLVDGAFVFEEVDAATGSVVATTRAPLTLRYVFRWEMEHLLARAGLHVEALFGDFAGGPFRAGGEQVWVARR